MSRDAQRIADNLVEVQGRMADAARRSGRDPASVRLVAVTKYATPEQARDVMAAGCSDLGESRPQQLWSKATALADRPIRWHLIGHLQRNKVRRTLPLIHLMHSGDSLRILTEVNAESQGASEPARVLLEVNISGDAEKLGFAPDEIEPLLPELARLNEVRIRGLMAMGGRDSDASQVRREFAQVRQLRDRLNRVCPPEISLYELSLGMSADYEMAIEEGATIVRVGSALFEGVRK